MQKKAFVPFVILFGLGLVFAWSLLRPRVALPQPVPIAKQTLPPFSTPNAGSTSEVNSLLTPTPDLSKGPAPIPPDAPPVAKPQYVDLAPSIPDRDKAAIVIRHKDGRIIEYLLPPDRIDSFMRDLDQNDTVVSRVPSLALMEQRPAPPNATPETDILPGEPPARSLPSPDRSAHEDIAKLLRNRPNGTQSVEIVVYDWQGGERVAPHGLDDQRCPELSSTSFLVDTPVPGTINFTMGGYGNWLPRYPPDEVAWLLPEFEGTVRLIKSLPPRDAYPPPMTSPVPTQQRGITYMPEPTAENVPGPTNIGYHVRLRGRLNEPVFQHCAHADRIFVIEAIEPLQMYHPYASVFAPPLPSDYAQWQRYSDPDLGFSFSYPPTGRSRAPRSRASWAA